MNATLETVPESAGEPKWACGSCGETYDFESEAEDCCQKDEAGIRAEFWENHPQFTEVPGREQNDYCCDIRCAFVDYIDSLARNGRISEARASSVTLGS